jgi:23S rRNA pseudouridine2605 synthase
MPLPSTNSISLIKALSQSGLGARRQLQSLIEQGAVSVDSKVITDLSFKLDPYKHKICLWSEPIPQATDKVYFILNKPKGYVCSHHTNSKKVIDIFKDLDIRLITVGRLDKDTYGLILVTNDGDFAQRIAHPSNQIAKEYLVKVNKEVEDHHLKIIAQGASVQGKWVKPKKVVKVRRGSLKITVTDGRKHEVKQLMLAADLQVLELTRIRVGGLSLGSLPIGQWRALTSNEIEAIFHS